MSCDHKYWNPYGDLMLCGICNDSFSKDQRPLYERMPKLSHIIDDNGTMQIFFDDNNTPTLKF